VHSPDPDEPESGVGDEADGDELDGALGVPGRNQRAVQPAIASVIALRTVSDMPTTSTIGEARQQQMMRRSLGRIVELDRVGAHRPAGLPFVDLAAPATGFAFPLGASTRRLDCTKRLKFQPGAKSLTTVLGWRDGVLDTIVCEGWLTLSQRPEQIAADRGRDSSYAGFTIAADGVERICLRRAHVGLLGVHAGADVLVALLPDSGRVIVVDPVHILRAAPGSIAALVANTGDQISPPRENTRKVPS
jgi:hypothetical protein